MGFQLLRHYRLIHRTKVDAGDVIQHCLDVSAKEYVGQDAHIIHIEFEQILATILYQWEARLADGFYL